MNHDMRWLVWAGAYAAGFGLAALGVFMWRIKRRGGRTPVAFKLLRGPGETLRRRIAKFDEDMGQNLLLCALGPPFAGLTVFVVLGNLLPSEPRVLWILLGAGVAVFLLGTVWSFRVTMQRLIRYRDDKLGYLGEREVAEHLGPLVARGYRVFHDVPAEGAKTDFNLDHVVVGPAGVALIEVKTRRKGSARPGRKDYVVTYDGTRLSWPYCDDRHGLDQAVNEAEWLQKFILQRTGMTVAVKPILALPGWWVEVTARGEVAVVNSKNVALAVEGKGSRVLSDAEIDLIARQLDTLCRDVED